MPSTPTALKRSSGEIEAFDLRKEQTNPPVTSKPKHKIQGGKVARRLPKSITGIVVHQTACTFGVTPSAIRAADGNKRLATARRALGVACHGLAFRDGFYAIANPIDWYVYHGNEFNSTTLGLEIEGFYSGLCDDPETVPREDLETTWGGKPQELTALAIDSARACLARLVELGRAEGCPLEWIYAHRQSSATRRSDPGEAIWRHVVLDYAIPVLGLNTRPKFVLGDGRPVPKQWQADGVGGY